MTEQSQGSAQPHAHDAPQPGASDRRVHRVCIQCNQMFLVTPENFEAKQCSACHKG